MIDALQARISELENRLKKVNSAPRALPADPDSSRDKLPVVVCGPSFFF